MRLRFVVLCSGVIASATLGASAPGYAAPQPAHSSSTPHSSAFFAGDWSSMGTVVTIVANRAMGPASRIIVKLPKNLQKSGQASFSLSRKSDDEWSGVQDNVTVSFKLISDNFGILSMVGDKPDHHFEMPLSRI
ncbi:hypothetical protein [Acetobacter sp.]|jgi:hypothetical protein|uniref:hypothetical protein n=1 Tax=Acetobacter sp. TaxID=440 RepID=UPI0025C3214E|nr:hypothetical protein [Acetobacter sp.]MCH4089723.1 hypothetical protein [Acetobacter sp.]MCI1298419.1 hypothetical protein [Acetobacter sp.]MCI1316374.1 hypothetical protein [Acetobacter sp.]